MTAIENDRSLLKETSNDRGYHDQDQQSAGHRRCSFTSEIALDGAVVEAVGGMALNRHRSVRDSDGAAVYSDAFQVRCAERPSAPGVMSMRGLSPTLVR